MVDHLTRKRVAVVTNLPFWLGTRGSYQRIDTMVRHLAGHFDLTVWHLGRMSIRQWMAIQRELPFSIDGPSAPTGWLKFLCQFVPGLRKISIDSAFRRVAQHFDSSDTRKLDSFRSEVIAAHFAKFVKRAQPDAILIQYVMLSYLCDFIPESARQRCLTLIDTHDVMSARKRTFESFGLTHWLDIDPLEEAGALAKVDVVVAIQEHEAELLKDMLPDRKIIIAKHAMQPNCVRKSDSSTITVGFLGSSGEANKFGVEQFIDNCWEQIRDQLDGPVQFLVAGSVCRSLDRGRVQAPGNIRLVGQVGKPCDFYATIDIAINPVRIESGLKTKSLEAIAHGIPLVSWRPGVVGLESACGRAVVVASSWDHFAQHVIRLARDPHLRNTFAEQAVRFVANEFSADRVYSELVKVIQCAT